jgi:tetratricopeptide (TPR) repeat protein
MNCPQCGSALPEDASLCPECGAPTVNARTNHSPEPLTSEISVALAEANLLRLRRAYDLATTKCVEILRRYPNNAPAHSLLGDIYRDRGEYSDALGWYELALQIDPANAADREKIQRIRDDLQRPAATAGDSRAWPPRTLGVGRIRIPFGLLLGLMLGCILIGALIALSMGRDSNRASMLPTVDVPRVIDPRTPPTTDTKTPQVREAPVQRPQPQVLDQDQPPSTYRPGGQPPAPQAASAMNPADREKMLLESLRAAAQAEDLMARVDSVVVDPRDARATLAITAQDAIATPESRDIIVVKSLRIADLALAQDPGLTRITVRCSAPVPDERGIQQEKVIFVGDVNPSALRQAAGRSLSIDEAMGLFSAAPWWHACMKPAQ